MSVAGRERWKTVSPDKMLDEIEALVWRPASDPAAVSPKQPI
jgi:hypothetical protein